MAVSPSPHKQGIQLLDRDLPPGRSAVVALVGAFGCFHLTQEGIHLVQGQFAVRPDGAVAGHGGEDVVLSALDDRAGVMQGEFGEDAAGEFDGVAFGQSRRHGADSEGFGGKGADVQTELQERINAFLRGGDFQRGGGEGGGDQERLTGQGGFFSRIVVFSDVDLRLKLSFKALVHNPFMGGVHVHNDQALCIFRQDVDALQLGDGAAQGPDGVV